MEPKAKTTKRTTKKASTKAVKPAVTKEVKPDAEKIEKPDESSKSKPTYNQTSLDFTKAGEQEQQVNSEVKFKYITH